MKTAVIQMAAGPNKKENLAKALKFVQEAIQEKAEFILLPEVFNYRGALARKSDLDAVKEEIPGPSTKSLMELARQYGVFILAGSIYESIKNSDKVFNTSVLIDDRGKIKGVYRKIHLFDAVIGKTVVKESYNFRAGKKGVAAAVKDFKVGLSVCYDLRFADLYMKYRQRGVQVLTVPSSFTRLTGQAHWEVLLRARAIENLCYVLAPNQIGKDSRGVDAYGNSMIISPWGEVLARASDDKEEIIYAELSLDQIKNKRSILPGFNS